MKAEFINALHAVPDSLLNRVFGTFELIDMPETEEDAIIAMGKLSANLNNLLLKPLSGLDLTELLLRVGQRNSTAISMLLSNLESFANYAANECELTLSGSPFPHSQNIPFSITGKNLKSVDVLVNYADGQNEYRSVSVTLEESTEELLSGTFAGAAISGEFTYARFVVSFVLGADETLERCYEVSEAEA